MVVLAALWGKEKDWRFARYPSAIRNIVLFSSLLWNELCSPTRCAASRRCLNAKAMLPLNSQHWVHAGLIYVAAGVKYTVSSKEAASFPPISFHYSVVHLDIACLLA